MGLKDYPEEKLPLEKVESANPPKKKERKKEMVHIDWQSRKCLTKQCANIDGHCLRTIGGTVFSECHSAINDLVLYFVYTMFVLPFGGYGVSCGTHTHTREGLLGLMLLVGLWGHNLDYDPYLVFFRWAGVAACKKKLSTPTYLGIYAFYICIQLSQDEQGKRSHINRHRPCKSDLVNWLKGATSTSTKADHARK